MLAPDMRQVQLSAIEHHLRQFRAWLIESGASGSTILLLAFAAVVLTMPLWTPLTR